MFLFEFCIIYWANVEINECGYKAMRVDRNQRVDIITNPMLGPPSPLNIFGLAWMLELTSVLANVMC